jgi:hypothetical protein
MWRFYIDVVALTGFHQVTINENHFLVKGIQFITKPGYQIVTEVRTLAFVVVHGLWIT